DVARRHHEIVTEELRAQIANDRPPDPSEPVDHQEIHDAADREDDRDRERQHPRVRNEIPALFDLLDEHFGVERGDDVAEQERQQNGSAAVENGGDGRSRDDEAVRMEVAEQAAVNRSRFTLRDAHRSRSARSRPTTMRRARAATGDQASGGVTVAMLTLTKPSWPATSIAVTTA